MSQRVKKLPSKGKGEDGTQTMSTFHISFSVYSDLWLIGWMFLSSWSDCLQPVHTFSYTISIHLLMNLSNICNNRFWKTRTHTKIYLCLTTGSKGKRKRPRVGGGTKGGVGGAALSGDDASQSQPDSASKTPWTPRYLSDLKSSNIYNRSATEAPAEVL